METKRSKKLFKIDDTDVKEPFDLKKSFKYFIGYSKMTSLDHYA